MGIMAKTRYYDVLEANTASQIMKVMF